MENWDCDSGESPVEETIFTGVVPGIAWFNDSTLSEGGATVHVWSSQNRELNNSMTDRIMVSVGVVDVGVIQTPHLAAYKSGIGPAVACYKNFANGAGNDCVMVFTNRDDGRWRLRSQRFAISEGSDGFRVSFEGTRYIDGSSNHARTSNRVALYYHEQTETFHLALRPHAAPQSLALWSSGDGVSWTLEDRDIGESDVGPSAPSYMNERISGRHWNIIGYTRP